MKWPRGLVQVDLQRDGRVFVQPYSVAVDGPWLMNELPLVMPSLEDIHMLGATILEAVEQSHNTVLPPRDLRTDPADRDFLAWLGVKNFADYAKDVRAVTIHGFFGDDPHILVTPQLNGGAKSGFEPIREHPTKLTDCSPFVLGKAVQGAIATR